MSPHRCPFDEGASVIAASPDELALIPALYTQCFRLRQHDREAALATASVVEIVAEALHETEPGGVLTGWLGKRPFGFVLACARTRRLIRNLLNPRRYLRLARAICAGACESCAIPGGLAIPNLVAHTRCLSYSLLHCDSRVLYLGVLPGARHRNLHLALCDAAASHIRATGGTEVACEVRGRARARVAEQAGFLRRQEFGAGENRYIVLTRSVDWCPG